MGQSGVDVKADDGYRLIVESLADGVVMLDREARCRYMNPAAARILERTDAQIVGAIFPDVVADPLASAFRAAFDRIKAGEEVIVLRNFFAAYRWREALAVPTGDRILLMFRDVTDRLQAEAARRMSEERCRIMVEGVKEHAIFLLDLKGRIASWNGGAQRITGYRADEVIGKDVAMFATHPDPRRPQIHEGLRAAATQGRFQTRHSFLRRDGSQFLGEVNINTVYDELGQPSGFACVVRDVTEQDRKDQLLRLSEERLRLATEAGEIGIWEYVVSMGQWTVDSQLLSLWGLPPGVRPSYDDVLARVHPDDRGAVHEHFQKVLAAGGDIHFEFRILMPENRVAWIEAQGKVLLDEAERPQRIVGTTRDVTERHRYDEFRELLPGILAHDLRSPLSAIKMAGERLRRTGAQGAPTETISEIILRSANQMARMIENLLEFTEVRFGTGLPVDRAPTDLAEVARNVVTQTQLAHPESDVHFETAGNTRGCWDAVRLGEVASNLIGNAIKHGQRGEPIDVCVRGNGSDVSLKVHNTGAPIPEESLPFIYEPFVGAGHSHGKASFEASLGLGLYIARALVQAHGGNIEVDSSREAGTTFTVHLPR
jgi:PAS domain S-box-containing protein